MYCMTYILSLNNEIFFFSCFQKRVLYTQINCFKSYKSVLNNNDMNNTPPS